jgi:cell filamentation protein, protein adenylyltransferase
LKNGGRYDVSGLIEAEYEPGSAGKVLRNLQRITNAREMDRIEAIALARATDRLIRKYDKAHQFREADVRYLHKRSIHLRDGGTNPKAHA